MIDLATSLPGDAVSLLSRPRLAYVGVVSKRGPHVTPELFTYFAGRFWIATAKRTLKSRTLGSGDRVGLLLKHGSRSLLVEGETAKLDPFEPLDALKAWREAPFAGIAMGSFFVRNATHLAGLFADPSALPHSVDTFRVPIAIRPERAVLLEGWRVATTLGRWEQTRAPSAPPDTGDPGDLPRSFAEISEGVKAAVLGWEVGDVALPLPAMWDGAAGTASVPAEVMSLIGGGDRARACVALERSAGERLDDKEGLLLRGEGAATKEGVVVEVGIDVSRATHWEGADTETVSA
jgi:hypothetical protein